MLLTKFFHPFWKITLFLGLLLFSANTYAQLGTSSVNGIILDQDSAAVGGARVVLRNKATGQTREVVTDETGSFRIQNLPSAIYEAKIEADNFTTALVDNVEVRVGEVPTLTVLLKPASTADSAKIEEAIEIKATDVLGVDTTSSQVDGVVSERTITNLPLNGRNFLDLAFLIAGNRPAPNFDPTKTNTVEISSAGQLGRGGNIAVDGADNNDDLVGGTLQNFPLDSVREFQIITNRFSADIGRSASSAINIITKSGTNEFHGSFASFFRNDSLSALPATLDPNIVRTLGQPPFDRQQYAGTFGGPIKRDRAWFFTALEYRNQDAIVLTGQRDLNQKRVVTSFSSAPLNDLLFLGRGDIQLRGSDHLSLRYALEDEDDIDRGSLRAPIGTADNRQKSFNNYQSFVSNFVHTFSPRAINDLSFQENNFINLIPTFANRPELRFPSVQDGGNFRIPQRSRQNRIQVRDNVSLTVGNHALKFGGEYQRVDGDLVFDLFGSGTVFLTQDFADRDLNNDGRIDDLDIPISVTSRSAAPVRPPSIPNGDNNFFALYIQDDWKVRPNFTLNIGLRYEIDSNAKNTKDFDQINPLISSFLGGRRRRDRNNLGPRIGFNWDPFKDGRTSIHGGYGIYYDRVVAEVPLLERLLDGRNLPLAVRTGSVIDPNTGMFVPGTPTLANPFTGMLMPGAGATGINIIDNNQKSPYVQQFNFGVEREIIRDLKVSVDGIHSFGSSFIIGRQIGTVFNPVVGGPDSVINLESSAKNWYDGLLVSAEKRTGKFTFLASYTLSKSFSFSNDDQIPFQNGPIDPNNLRLEKGPTPNDERHRFSFAGTFDAPFGITVAPIYVIASDVPFEINLPDGSRRIPLIQRNAGGRQFRTGAQLNSFIRQINSGGGIAGVGLLPLVNDNLNFGDGFTSLDLRVSKTVKLNERMNIQAIVEMFNLFNVTNVLGVNNINFSGFQNALIRDSNDPNNPGFLRSSSFGSKVTTAGGVFGTGGPRAFQLVVRMNF